MTETAQFARISGILAHITSLPSPYGIGDMGCGTADFLQFLRDAQQSLWQILPFGPTDSAFANSPYMSVSAFAGNPLLISPEKLYFHGLLSRKDLGLDSTFSPYTVDFPKIICSKAKFLRAAYAKFKPAEHPCFEEFVARSFWLHDYCLFMALKSAHPGKAWYQWDRELVLRKPNALAKASQIHHEEILYRQFEQFIFFHQWKEVVETAHAKNIKIFGDIPIYVSLDSTDVWSHQSIFQLNPKTGLPTHVAGVPPDYFSDTGQKWGNPLYAWNSEDEKTSSLLLNWWTNRFSHIFENVDIARIDHFRGFESYWAIPATHDTALHGKWLKGPGAQFFHDIFARLGKLNIVAEDLGEITEEVIALRENLHFPGMRILQFAFDGNPRNSYLPFNYDTANTYVYTGTHDNNTTVGWYLDQQVDDHQRSSIKKMANRKLGDDHDIHKDLIYLAMSSVASVAMIPLQDILGFGADCRMNTPGTVHGNWQWRCSNEFITADLANWLKELTLRFGRDRLPFTQ